MYAKITAASSLMKAMDIGYMRAVRYITLLEQLGILSTQVANPIAPRQILADV
jgi:DNA segregation ATPase FtsK/SpoIIIE-like protein